MDITLVTTAKTDEEARELLKLMGLPLTAASDVGPDDRAARMAKVAKVGKEGNGGQKGAAQQVERKA